MLAALVGLQKNTLSPLGYTLVVFMTAATTLHRRSRSWPVDAPSSTWFNLSPKLRELLLTTGTTCETLPAAALNSLGKQPCFFSD